MNISIPLPNSEATRSLGFALGQSLPRGSIILLSGNLGAGKTTFVQGLGQGLGITDSIVSPTFTLINEYLGGRLPLYHLDLYRLLPKEVESLYLEAYWEGSDYPLGIVAIEWSERLPYQPNNYLHIHLTSCDDNSRLANLSAIRFAIPAGIGDFQLESDWISFEF